jgi:transposase, IS5 family
MLILYTQRDEEFEQQAAQATQAEPWLQRWDELLEDEELLEDVRADLAGRYPLTTKHGRHSTPVEVIVRLLVVKQLCQWSYQQTVEQVSQRLALRWLCRLGGRPVPAKTTLMRWAQLLRPQTQEVLTERVRCLLSEPHRGRKTPRQRKVIR